MKINFNHTVNFKSRNLQTSVTSNAAPASYPDSFIRTEKTVPSPLEKEFESLEGQIKWLRLVQEKLDNGNANNEEIIDNLATMIDEWHLQNTLDKAKNEGKIELIAQYLNSATDLIKNISERMPDNREANSVLVMMEIAKRAYLPSKFYA